MKTPLMNKMERSTGILLNVLAGDLLLVRKVAAISMKWVKVPLPEKVSWMYTLPEVWEQLRSKLRKQWSGGQ